MARKVRINKIPHKFPKLQYAIGKSTLAAIVHDGIIILRDKLVTEAIRFPTGPQLDQVMIDFEALCGLP